MRLTLQPTFQYVVPPGRVVADPYGGGFAPISEAEVFGATTTIKF